MLTKSLFFIVHPAVAAPSLSLVAISAPASGTRSGPDLMVKETRSYALINAFPSAAITPNQGEDMLKAR
jgi:hypothetical protein